MLSVQLTIFSQAVILLALISTLWLGFTAQQKKGLEQNKQCTSKYCMCKYSLGEHMNLEVPGMGRAMVGKCFTHDFKFGAILG